MSLKCSALVACLGDVMRLSFTAKRSRYLTDNGYMLLGLLPAGTAEVETEDMKVERTWIFRCTGSPHWRVCRLKN